MYVVNYFNKDISTSIFFATPDASSQNIEDGNLDIYGDSFTTVYMIPDYSTSTETTTSDGEEFAITKDGVLSFRNVAYNLSKNNSLGINNELDKDASSGFSSPQNLKQKIVFKKTASAKEGDFDTYKLVPILQTTIRLNGKEYVFYKVLDVSQINLKLVYHEKARSIKTTYTSYAIDTNEVFSDVVEIDSTNPQELLFYEIRKADSLIPVQQKMPEIVGQYGMKGDVPIKYEEYINDITGELFDIKFDRIKDNGKDTNNFKFTCGINTQSNAYKQRFNSPIEGEYVFHFYSSELTNGVDCTFYLTVNEARLNYIKVNNYSNVNNVTLPNNTVVPGQKGILEISLNPVEAIFDRFTITNNEINSILGSGTANFEFAYQQRTETGVQYKEVAEFGSIENGLSFTYRELMELYSSLQEEDKNLTFRNKIYITYFVASLNVEDNVPVQFDVRATFGEDEYVSAAVQLTTKLESYAKLVFDDKDLIGNAYYIARGLTYDMSLDSFGFTEEQVTVKIGQDEVALSSLQAGHDFGGVYMIGSQGKYTLTVNNNVQYNGDVGFRIEVNTSATKIQDGIETSNSNTTNIYVMEYVLNYTYVEGINEDIVYGMRNGIVNVAVGNPFELSLQIANFLEYNTEDATIVQEVEDFVTSLSNSVDWKVVFMDEEQLLAENKKIVEEQYYSIDGLVVTPLRVYDPESDIYHFSVSGHYVMRNGRYAFTRTEQNSNILYAEFVMRVHDQSTEDSPIPVRTYEDLMNMAEGQWYILLNEIEIPNNAEAEAKGLPVFAPISTAIAGLDGNSCDIVFSGEYDFEEGVSNVGLFSTVSDNVPNINNKKYSNNQTILQNISIRVDSDVRFKLNVPTFNVGLLAAQNDGIITNAEVYSNANAKFYVSSLQNSSESYVAGLVVQNGNGAYITNSRSRLNISARANVSGFVGQNLGHIASSYFRGATIENNTDRTQEVTAGFVVANYGQIYTSYVSGDSELNNSSMYYKETSNSIRAVHNVAGFVYTNSGSVQDCYSNININQSRGYAAGFVFENSGVVERAFSTSVLQSERTANFGFARLNSVTTGQDGQEQVTGGVIKDAFYLTHNEDANDGNINVDISNIEGENTEILPIDIDEFKITGVDEKSSQTYLEKYFKNFIIAQTRKTNGQIVYGRNINGVWFYNEDAADHENFNDKFFNVGRVELVAPNMIARSDRRLYDTIEVRDETTGAEYVRYVYNYTGNRLGSAENPILISSPAEFENYIVNENDPNNINTSSYRLVSNLDYDDDQNGYDDIGKTYKTKFMGYFEGNFMSISGNIIISGEKQTFGGLFAEIGSGSTVMNFTYNPSNVTFSNTSVVGALAGKVEGAKLYNIDILNTSGNQNGTMIIGNNITGGAIGLTLGDFEIRNLYCQFGAKSRNQFTGNGNIFDSVEIFDNYSFAGSYVGVLSGSGTIYDAVVDRDIQGLSVLGGKAGLVFGLVDENASVIGGSVDMSGNRMLNGYMYAGLVVGENKGTIQNFKVESSGALFTEIRSVPFIPTAVGGFAGLISGGTLSNITMLQGISLSEKSVDSGIKYVGGIAGQISASSTLKDITVNANLVGFEFVGGVVGNIQTNDNVRFENISVEGDFQVLSMSNKQAGIGGLVGSIDDNAYITLTSEPEKTNTFNISAYMHAFVYQDAIDVYLGAIIGQNNNRLHNIQNASSSIISSSETKGIEVEDLVVVGSQGNKAEGRIYVTTEGEIVKLQQPIVDYVTVNHSVAASCTTYCDIQYVIPKDICRVELNLIGALKDLSTNA